MYLYKEASKKDLLTFWQIFRIFVGFTVFFFALIILSAGMRDLLKSGTYSCTSGNSPYIIRNECSRLMDISTLMPILLFLGIFLYLSASFKNKVLSKFATIFFWSSTFILLGWNFLEFGIVNPPSGKIDIGSTICFVLFTAMGLFPIFFEFKNIYKIITSSIKNSLILFLLHIISITISFSGSIYLINQITK